MLRTRTLLGTAALVLATACASVPTLQFNGDDDGGVSGADGSTADALGANDSTVTFDAGGGQDTGLGDDANTLSDAEFNFDADEAAVPRYKCGAKMVVTCANCDGNPMLCLDNGRNECLTDCQICNTALAPCVRCLPNGRVVGQCVAPGPAGVVTCGHSAERCPCTGDAGACPLFAGSNQTCIDDGSGLGCETCGEVGTANAVCETSAGVFGKCQKNGPKVGMCK